MNTGSFKNPIYKICIYKSFIYIYIVIHIQTVSLYPNSSVWLDTQDAASRDRNPPNFTLNIVSNRSVISTTYASSGIITHLY